MTFPIKKYSIIYADPAWLYKDKANAGQRGAIFQYPCMDIDAIKSLPIQTIASNDSILFIWVTFPLLQEGLDTIEAWGFKYKTIGFNWIKKTKHGHLFWGMGNWTRSNSEICLIGVRGKPKRISAAVHSVIDNVPYEGHSKKPNEIRNRIVQLCGDIPRIELFARQTAPGWDSWGNQIQ